MILLIDAGNTRIKWRLLADASAPAALDEGALGHDGIDALGQLRTRHPGPLRVVGSNVAGTDVADRITAALAVNAVEWLCPTQHACGVRNLYDIPGQLGADRWAALIGAHHTHAQACLVVTAGTATTADLLSADGDFLGGLILPGVDLMQASLARGTAQLPLAEGRFVPQPRCTVDAIRSGCLHAQAGAIERMFRQIATERGALCLLGGGAADSFAGLLDIPLRRIDNLVLCGLAVIAGLHSPNA
ncbi:MAG: type III pantothenate kinase [Thauera propionica]|jgi:type III pantothenate kinase|uniref:Type III pantothenate kinase n=1 Tax=Thauera propionica TaxID=2019431 RepID=A0A235EY91_9RHOO|nr:MULTISPECIES: type III pantothenate kinase [Thauera]MDD3676262.1 type III pantothenate kinase [Thauera propionica]MDI3489936.1 type pantothenate kinase [Thauera sp.]MDY0046470.1 type III pantothenate kinase [Thauera propionica]OYD53547.1 type III pantothenate kinase [Thauera propionica]